MGLSEPEKALRDALCTRCRVYPSLDNNAGHVDGLCWPCRYDDRLAEAEALKAEIAMLRAKDRLWQALDAENSALKTENRNLREPRCICGRPLFKRDACAVCDNDE